MPASDDAGGSETRELFAVDADFGEDLCVVLAETGREHADARRGACELQRVSMEDDLAEVGMRVALDHAARDELWIVDQLVGARHARAWHVGAAGSQRGEHLVAGALVDPVADDGVDLAAMLRARPVMLEALVTREL